MTAVFSGQINWEQPFISRRAYHNWTFTAKDGTEQRSMLRQIPQRQLAFNVTTVESENTGWLDQLLYGGQNERWAIPFWPHVAQLSQTANPGTSVALALSTTDRDFIVGESLILYRDERTTELCTITAKTSTSVSVALLVGTWTPGTLVIPALFGKWTDDPNIARPCNVMADLPVAFDIEPGIDPDLDIPTEPEVFDVVRPLNDTLPSDALVRGVDRLASPTYTFTDYDRTREPAGRRTLAFTLESKAQVAAMEAWFDALRGGLTTFYMPTWQRDFVVISGLGTSTLVVEKNDYTNRSFPLSGRHTLALIDSAGNVTKAIVTAAEEGAETETLELDIVAPVGTVLVSFLLYVRLESDILSVLWHSAEIAEITLQMIECPGELAPTEEEAATPDTPAGVVSPAQSTATVPNGEKDVPTFIMIYARDADGRRRTTGGDTPAGTVTGAVTATITWTDLDNGSYRGQYTPTATGTVVTVLTLNGTPVKNSPFTTVVGTTPVDLPNAMPFGFWRVDQPQIDATYGPMTLCVRTITRATAVDWLDRCASAGVTAIMVLSRDLTKDSAGRFSVSNFEDEVDNIASAPGFAAHVGTTLKYHWVLDDVFPAHWGGQTPTIAQLSAACAKSKAVWPQLQRIIDRRDGGLAGVTDMDYANASYRARLGDPTEVRAREERLAREGGWRLCGGLFTLTGGDGSSGIRGTSQVANTWAMSGPEIVRYGKIMAASPMCDLFTLWRWPISDSERFADYYALPSIQAAVEELADFCNGEVR
jgi:hypothetical protein